MVDFSHTCPEQRQNAAQSRCSSFIFLQTRMMCPVWESMRVIVGSQLQVTVLAFSCLVTTQCSIVSAEAGGKWLRIGGGAAAAGCFFVAQPLKSIHRSSPATARPFSMPSVFALFRPSVDGKFDYLSREEYGSTVMSP